MRIDDNFKPSRSIVALMVLACALGADAQSTPEMPRIVNQGGHAALMLEGAPYFVLGAQIHNSSSWRVSLPKVWALAAGLHVNTIEAPIYWEQMEQQPGEFNYSTVDMLIRQAREHRVHLILLWFGTWKNGRMHYVPEWIKTNSEKYPRVKASDGESLDILSPYSESNVDADKSAFAALMRHVKAIDAEQQTVIMVQVENESGLLGSARDYSPAASALFFGPVPEKLVLALHLRSGTWTQVFGDDADEAFSAYGVSRYVNEVAAAGKAEYALPMYCNDWLHLANDVTHPYPVGGPTANMLDIWKVVAPSIDLIGPDVYVPNGEMYRSILHQFHRPDNPMWIPETLSFQTATASQMWMPGTIGFGEAAAVPVYLFYALNEDAIGFAPFGLDSMPEDIFSKHHSPQIDALAANYRLLGSMDRPLAELLYEGKVKVAVEEPMAEVETLDFGKWRALIYFSSHNSTDGSSQTPRLQAGRILIAPIGPDQFVVAGFSTRVDFVLANSASHEHPQYLRVEEGIYEGNSWKATRWLNGDETDYGMDFGKKGSILHVALGSYR